MTLSTALRVVDASRVSDAVLERVGRSAPQLGRVEGVFRSAVNVTTSDGLVTLIPSAAPGLPNGVHADLGPDLRRAGLEPGMTVHVCDRELVAPDAGLRITWLGATRWSPRLRVVIGGSERATGRWRRRARRARAHASRHAPAGGFGPLLATGRAAHADDAPTTGRAGAALAGVARAITAGDRHAAADGARALIGLGVGLTPSGDDALVGIEAALRSLGHPMAGFLAATLADVDRRTTTVGATLLRHASRGDFAEALHRLLGELLGDDDRAVALALERAVAWGATSGTDCVVGVLTGLDAAAGGRPWGA